MPAGARRSALFLLLLFALCCAFYWKLLFTSQYPFLDSPDLANLVLPRMQFLASELRHLRFPLWDPYQWCGQPFLAQFTGAAYPLNWLLALRFEHGKVSFTLMHWLYVLIHFQAAAFAFWLCRDLKLSHGAALLGGLIFALAGFMGDTDWPEGLNGAVWGPAILLFLLRSVRGLRPWSSAALSGVCLGMAWLSGHHEAPIYLTFAAAAFWLANAVIDRSRAPRILCAAVLSLAIAVLVSGFQTLPGLEYARQAIRWAGWEPPLRWDQPIPYVVHQNFSFTPSSLAGVVVPYLAEHVNPFLGVAALTLALLGVLTNWKQRREVRLFTFTALSALFLSMAAYTWCHGLLYSTLPLFGKARVPARLLLLFTLAASPLAAFGLDALRHACGHPWARRLNAGLWAAAALGFTGLIAISLAGNAPLRSPLAVTWLGALATACLLAAWRHSAFSGRTLSALFILLMLWEVGNVSGARMPNRSEPRPGSPLLRLEQNQDIASMLRVQKRPFRAEILQEVVPDNFGLWQGIEMTGGFGAAVTSQFWEIEPYKPRIRDLLNVEYTLARTAAQPDQIEILEAASGVKIFRNPGAFPRARIVHNAVQAPSFDRLRRLYDNPAFNLHTHTALLTTPPALDHCAPQGEQASVLRQEARYVELDVRLNCRGLVILADNIYPGWRAELDGATVPILPADGSLRGVVVPAGKHRLVFRFEPLSVYFGAAMTLTGLLAAVVLRLRQV